VRGLLLAILPTGGRCCVLLAARLARRFPAFAWRSLVALAAIPATTSAAAVPATTAAFAMLAIARSDRIALRDGRNDRIGGRRRVRHSARLARSAWLLTFTLIVALAVTVAISSSVARFATRAIAFLVAALLRRTALSTGLNGVSLTFTLAIALPVASVRTSGLATPAAAVTITAASTTSCVARRFSGV